MAARSSRYRKMEQYMTYAILADAVLFVLYLIFAGLGVTWAKFLFAGTAILLSILILIYLYLTRELLRRRSFWMTTAAAAVIICTLFSLVLRFPGPQYEVTLPNTQTQESVQDTIPETT